MSEFMGAGAATPATPAAPAAPAASPAQPVGEPAEAPTLELDTIGLKLAPYNPTNQEALAIALGLLRLRDGDRLYDLGCGDGRLLVEACLNNPGITAVGVEYDLNLVKKAQQNVNENGLADRVTILHNNVLDVDFSDATALFIYLLPQAMAMLHPKLTAMLAGDRGVRIVTYIFSIPNVPPKQVELYKKSTKFSLYQSS